MKKTDFKNELKKLEPKNFLFLIVAGLINAFGVTVFISPVGLYDSGISGTSIFAEQLTPEMFSLSFFLLILNIPLFLIGYKRQGICFTVYACFAVMCYSLFAWIITDILPVDVSVASPLAKSDLFLCALFGGLISGIGSGLAIRFGGAMDGIEVLAVIFSKKLGVTVGTFVMGYNILLYMIIGIVNGSWILPLYSIVTYAAAIKVVDFIVEGLDRGKGAFIVTEKGSDICAELSEEFKCGITILQAHGFYSDTEKQMLYIVINRFQIRRLKELVHNTDPLAYITINDVADVFSATSE